MTKNTGNFYLWARQRICIVMLLSFCLSPISAQAIPLLPSPDDNNRQGSDWMRFAGRYLGEQYNEVIKLLQQGKREQAKLALGVQIARKPESRGYEMAGIIFLEDGDAKLALEAFNSAIRLAPNSISAHARRGLALLTLGEMEKGRDELLQVLRSQPDNVIALRYLGWFQDIYGHTDSSIAYYSKLLETEAFQGNTLTTIHLELARLYNQQGNNQKAIDIITTRKEPERTALLWVLRQYSLFDSYISLSQTAKAASILKQFENSSFAGAPEVAIRKAILAQAQGDMDAAERELQALIDTNASYLTPASMQLTKFWIGQNKPEKAVKVLKNAIAKESDVKNLKLLLQGFSSLQVERKQYADVISVLKDAVQKYPDKPYIGYLLFEVRLTEGNQIAAMKTLRETLARSPDFSDGWYAAGKLARRLNKDDAAEKDFQRAVNLDPYYTEAWIELARLLFEKGREKEMEFVLKRSISKNPLNAQLPFELASLYESQHKIKQANKVYRVILQLYPDHVAALNNLALNLAREPGNDAEAVELARRAHELLPQEAIPMATYGWVTLLGGDVRNALPLLEKAIKIEQRDIGMRHYLAVAYLKSGRPKAAEAQLEEAENMVASKEEKHRLKKFLTKLRSGHNFSDEELRAIFY